jgi:hypothetical protein
MSVTVKNIVDEVRLKVSDSEQPYRWTDPQIVVIINDAVQHTFSMRPDSSTAATLDGPEELTSMYDEIPLRRQFRSAIMYYTSAMLLQDRSSDKSLRTQGSDFMKLFNALVGA